MWHSRPSLTSTETPDLHQMIPACHSHSRTVSPCQARCTSAPESAFATPVCTRDSHSRPPQVACALSFSTRTPRVPQTPKHRAYDQTKPVSRFLKTRCIAVPPDLPRASARQSACKEASTQAACQQHTEARRCTPPQSQPGVSISISLPPPLTPAPLSAGSPQQCSWRASSPRARVRHPPMTPRRPPRCVAPPPNRPR